MLGSRLVASSDEEGCGRCTEPHNVSLLRKGGVQVRHPRKDDSFLDGSYGHLGFYVGFLLWDEVVSSVISLWPTPSGIGAQTTIGEDRVANQHVIVKENREKGGGRLTIGGQEMRENGSRDISGEGRE